MGLIDPGDLPVDEKTDEELADAADAARATPVRDPDEILDDFDEVDEAGKESFPASDPTAFNARS
jgi:hypothetical protein